jgi:hypothetical protein
VAPEVNGLLYIKTAMAGLKGRVVLITGKPYFETQFIYC